MLVDYRPISRLILLLFVVATLAACSSEIEESITKHQVTADKTAARKSPKISYDISPSEFEFTPEKIKTLEAKFLANIADDITAVFPPLEDYKAASIVRGQEDVFCQDAARVIEENLKPQNLNTPVNIESLEGYEAVYLNLQYGGSAGFASLPENAPADGRIRILPFQSLDRTTLVLIDFGHGADRTRYLFTNYYASWRGNGGQIVRLKDPNLSLDMLSEMALAEFNIWLKNPNNTIMILDYFIGQDSKIIMTPDNRLFLQHLTGHAVSHTEFYLLPNSMNVPPNSMNFRLYCQVSSDYAQHRMPKPSLTAYTEQLKRIQGEESVGGGSLNIHGRLQHYSSFQSSQLYTVPWRMERPYNKLAGLKSQLKAWSFKDPWSRREYLSLLSKYEEAYSDIEALFEGIYAKPVSDELVKQSIFNLTGAYFTFPARYYDENYISPELLTTKIYLGLVNDEDLLNGIASIKENPIETPSWGRKTEQLHDILAASLFNSDVFSGLLETKPIPLDAPNSFGKTVLMFAAHLNMHDKARLLLEAGADVNAVTYLGRSRSVLDYAIENAEIDLIELLLSKEAKLAPVKQAKYSLKVIPLEDILALNPHLDDAQKADLKDRITPRVVIPFVEK